MTPAPLATRLAALCALLCGALAGCRHAKPAADPDAPTRPVFHYATDSTPAQLDTDLTGVLNPQGQTPASSDASERKTQVPMPGTFAAGYRFELPAAGTLHVDAGAAPDGTELDLAIYTGGARPRASTATAAMLDAHVDKPGPCYVVVSVPLWSWQATYHLHAVFAADR